MNLRDEVRKKVFPDFLLLDDEKIPAFLRSLSDEVLLELARVAYPYMPESRKVSSSSGSRASRLVDEVLRRGGEK